MRSGSFGSLAQLSESGFAGFGDYQDCSHPVNPLILIQTEDRKALGPNLVVTGHPDTTGVLTLFGGEAVAEVKTRGPETYKRWRWRWRTLGADRSHPESVYQAALYSYGTFGEERDVVIATMDTGSRAWDFEVIPAGRVTEAFHRACARLGELAADHIPHGLDSQTLPERDFTADAFARDSDTGGLWFLSMVGPQTALKAIWASLLKQPPDTAHLIKGVEGMALSGGYQQCQVPHHTVGTWATRIARLPVSRGWHALVYTRLAEFSFERDDFLLLAQDQAAAPGLHHRFLDRRSPLPLHRSWRDWLWRRGLDTGEIVPLESAGLLAYTCNPRGEELKADLSAAVAAGTLTLNQEDTSTEVDNDG